jgi:mono/diheme cytochrome c family protein
MRKGLIYSVFLILTMAIVAACGGAAPTSTPKPEPTTEPTTAGPQTPQQVTAGMQIYDSQCARCHGANLDDGFAPKLSKPTLVKRGTAQELFDYIRQNMPRGNPGSLSEQEYYDVTSYLLFKQDLLQADQLVNSETASSITLSE